MTNIFFRNKLNLKNSLIIYKSWNKKFTIKQFISICTLCIISNSNTFIYLLLHQRNQPHKIWHIYGLISEYLFRNECILQRFKLVCVGGKREVLKFNAFVYVSYYFLYFHQLVSQFKSYCWFTDLGLMSSISWNCSLHFTITSLKLFCSHKQYSKSSRILLLLIIWYF